MELNNEDMIEHIEGKLCEEGTMTEKYVEGKGLVRKFTKEGLENYLSEIVQTLKNSKELDELSRDIVKNWMAHIVERL